MFDLLEKCFTLNKCRIYRLTVERGAKDSQSKREPSAVITTTTTCWLADLPGAVKMKLPFYSWEKK